MNEPTAIEVARTIVERAASWVLFRHDTCVTFVAAPLDPAAEAVALLKLAGPVRGGSEMGDFRVHKLKNFPGWVVTSHHDQVFTLVAADEVLTDQWTEMHIGFHGRAKRELDARELEVVHVESDPKVA